MDEQILAKKKKELQELVETFHNNKDRYKSQSYNEANTRLDFIDKFFTILDWDVGNIQGFAEEYRDVVVEDKLVIEGKPKAPDYSFRIGGHRKFFVEAKKPAVNLKDDRDPAYQVRRYGYTAKVPLSVLTDFEEFVIYDTRVKPNAKDSSSVARIFYCTYENYLEKFEEIYNIFSKPAIQKGSFDRYAENNKGKKGTSEVDKEFLKTINVWRELLAKNIAIRNPDVTIHELNYAVQKIIDRIIFLRIAEDRKMEEYGKLQDCVDAVKNGKYGSVYEAIQQLFVQADKKYNAGLFVQEDFLKAMKIDDKIFKTIIGDTYYPQCPYEFSVLGVEILGHIYEQFLGKTIRLTNGHQAKVEEKPEVRKAGGVFYTPQYIVDYIVKNTIGEKIKKKTPAEVAEMTFVDPACGSGSFLLGVYDYLLNWHLLYYSDEKRLKKSLKDRKIYEAGADNHRLTIEEKQRILVNNIYGVDIDAQAVEVTKLSLYLKLMEGETDQSTGQLFSYSDLKLLPNLKDNIKCGNSLIGSDFYSQQDSLFDIEQQRNINAFDWETEFASVFSKGGFDCVVGNPPYVSSYGRQAYNFSAEETRYYGQQFQTFSDIKNRKNFSFNLIMLFIEKGLSLLKKDGLLQFIIDQAIYEVEVYKHTREYILNNAKIFSVVTDVEFPGVVVETTILGLQKTLTKENYKIKYYKQNIDKPHISLLVKDVSDGGNFTFSENIKITSKIKNAGNPLCDYFETFTGMQIIPEFFLSDDDAVLHKEKWHKAVFSKNIERYFIKRPVAKQPGKYITYDNELQTKIRADLQKRIDRGEKCRTPASLSIGSPDKEYRFFAPKLIISQTVSNAGGTVKLQGSIDDKEGYYGNVSIHLVKDTDPTKLKTLLGIINSKLITFYAIETKLILGAEKGSKKTPQIRKLSIDKLPIPQFDKTNDTQRGIIQLVDQMLEAQKKVREVKLDSERKLYEQQISVLDRKIEVDSKSKSNFGKKHP